MFGYGLGGQFGYHLWELESRSILRSSDVVFNETKMHKQPFKEVEYRKVTFSDVTPLVQRSNEPNIPQVNAPVDRATEQVSTSQLRRSQRVPHPPDRYVPGVDFVFLTDSGEPDKEAMLENDKRQ